MLLLATNAAKGQTFDASNSIARVALVLYVPDDNGFYKKQENVSLPEVSVSVKNYGYNRKSQELYLVTEHANCVVTVNSDMAKILKNSKIIPQLKEKELTELSLRYSQELEEKIDKLNATRAQQIEDSIAKAKADSIENVNRQAKVAKLLEEYRNSHRWVWAPIGKTEVGCSLCSHKVKNEDSLYIRGIINDTLYYADLEEGYLGLTYLQYHMIPIPKKLKENADFSFHITAFADSIESNSNLYKDLVEYINDKSFAKYVDELKKEAPYGFIKSWSWDEKYSMVTMYLKYTNTNKKTIKYIDVHFKVTNDVGDVRKTGVFKGTGPVEEWESCSWDWDSSSYYVSKDASKMSITQITLTYMDGTKITLPKNKLHFN